MTDDIVYRTEATDGCRLETTITVGRDWLLLDPKAFGVVEERINRWRALAMAWHDQGNHRESAA